ncbi:hypothetical protein ACQKWADRAFT_330525 [Trichoderma austrokoningii]
MDPKLPWILFPPDAPREQSANIQIGAILTDPFRPNQVLTIVDNSILNAYYPPVEETHQLNRIFTWIADKAAPSFFRRCWEHLSSSLSVISTSSEKHTRYQVNAGAIITKEFAGLPRPTEIMARLASPTVDRYMSARGLWRREKPVYMVTGLKYAQGRIVFREEGIKATEFRFRRNIISPIIWTDRYSSPTPIQDWTADEDILIAYTLLKIEKNHRRKNDSDDGLILSEVVVEGLEW